MKYVSSLLLAGTLLASVPAATAQQASSPYRTRFAVDAPITALFGIGAGTGLYLIQQKHGLSEAEQAALNKNDVPKIDRWVAGKYSDNAQLASDLLCYPTLVIAPGLLALNDNVRGRYGQVLGLYVQALAFSDAAFTLSAGNVYRYRPYLYGTEGPANKRGSRIATNSFFAGHTAHTATATFFAAKVFHDFNPDSPAQPYVWGAAALVPAGVALFRMEAGKHFLTDNLLGYTVGAASGILVPQLHKTAGRAGMSVVPLRGINANGFGYSGLLISKQL
ncbi:phosphatase PAP2 family protein [Hymenobacter busanensis]|uniref:Phosphatase PAP2 family protein n=1 Tax=Hymenobacter busanensis TaxID=2607656 RepID=A0A7L5A1B2_9BACT|nr:phosphatase PAP2 family protein [Hymenobacter busanensis]KAA9331634.1 phosphatase PAP2 family protein [Hymenobacter busanensis]QHJ08785.1 phosphatase PAP2 family protein [Hymenobacter busanensis]